MGLITLIDKLPLVESTTDDSSVEQIAEVLLENDRRLLVYVAGRTRDGCLVYSTHAVGKGNKRVITDYHPYSIKNFKVKIYMPLKEMDDLMLENLEPLKEESIKPHSRVDKRAEITITSEEHLNQYHLAYVAGMTSKGNVIYEMEAVKKFGRLYIENEYPFSIGRTRIELKEVLPLWEGV